MIQRTKIRVRFDRDETGGCEHVEEFDLPLRFEEVSDEDLDGQELFLDLTDAEAPTEAVLRWTK